MDAEEKEAQDPTGSRSLISSSIPPSSPNGFGIHSPKTNRNPSSAQKLFEDGLIKEAEARAKVTHVHGNTYHFQRTLSEVQKSNLNLTILVNARGDPYVEGDPNLGYSLEDTKPRNAPPQFKSEAGVTSIASPHISPADGTNSKPQYPLN